MRDRSTHLAEDSAVNSPNEEARRTTATPAERAAAFSSEETVPYSRWACIRDVLRLSKYGLGVFLILCVTVIWVASSEWIQYIFGDLEFDKPYFLTYFNTTGFMLWNLGYLVKASWRRIPFRRVPTDDLEGQDLEEYILAQNEAEECDSAIEETGGLKDVHQHNNNEDSQPHGVSEPVEIPIHGNEGNKRTHKGEMLKYDDSDLSKSFDVSVKKPPYSFLKIWTCAVLFCPAWFVANYLFNLSLSYTTVSSNTILSATSTIWTLFLSYVLLRIAVGPLRWAGVVVCLVGTVLVALCDSEGTNTVKGDIMALVSAFMYAVYTSVLQWCLPDDDRYSMGQAFGAVGVINFVVLWFPMFILNATKYEVFQFPTASQAWPLVLNALIGTNLSDVLWARSVILTSPVVATLGLSLTTPLSMVVDAIIYHRTYKAQYIVGALLVLCGFVVANLPFTVTWGSVLPCIKKKSRDVSDEEETESNEPSQHPTV